MRKPGIGGFGGLPDPRNAGSQESDEFFVRTRRPAREARGKHGKVRLRAPDGRTLQPARAVGCTPIATGCVAASAHGHRFYDVLAALDIAAADGVIGLRRLGLLSYGRMRLIRCEYQESRK